MDSALEVTSSTEKQPFTVWIFKQFSPKKKSRYISLQVILLNLDLGACGCLSLASFHKKHDFVRIERENNSRVILQG